MKTCKYWTI